MRCRSARGRSGTGYRGHSWTVTSARTGSTAAPSGDAGSPGASAIVSRSMSTERNAPVSYSRRRDSFHAARSTGWPTFEPQRAADERRPSMFDAHRHDVVQPLLPPFVHIDRTRSASVRVSGRLAQERDRDVVEPERAITLVEGDARLLHLVLGEHFAAREPAPAMHVDRRQRARAVDADVAHTERLAFLDANRPDDGSALPGDRVDVNGGVQVAIRAIEHDERVLRHFRFDPDGSSQTRLRENGEQPFGRLGLGYP